MIGANQYTLTWDYFAELHPDKRSSFENLCRALFLRTFCDNGTILHSDPNHPGVEVEPVYSSKEDCCISFQAKYFDNGVGYAKIKESARKTVAKYKGVINRIYIYCNVDIKADSKSYTEIVKLLSDADIEAILVTGQTILDQTLEFPPLLSAYFGLDYLDEAWFNQKLSTSLCDLGNRYNSRFNIDTEAQKQLELFLREDCAVQRINQKKEEVLNALHDVRWKCDQEEKACIDVIRREIKSIPDIDAISLATAITWGEQLQEVCYAEIEKIEKKQNTLSEHLNFLDYKDSAYEETREKLFTAERILAALEGLYLNDVEINCIKDQVAVVTGEMGNGKTQLLATSAKKISEAGGLSLLFLGQTFISSETIEKQMITNLSGLSNGWSLESLLSVLEEYASRKNKNSVIFIDAINESRDREIWKIGINQLLKSVAQFEHVRLVISLRSGFEKLTLSDAVIKDIDSESGPIVHICHNGFSDESPEAVYEFLSACGIPFSPEYYLQSEMSNPLFLMWFSQTYSGEEQNLYDLISKVMEKADAEASKEAKSVEPYNAVRDVLYSIVEHNANINSGVLDRKSLLELPVWNTYGIVDKVAYIKAIERVGLLTSYIRDGREKFYIGYNMLEDYLSAERIFDINSDKQSVRDYIKESLLGNNTSYHGNNDLFALAAAMYAAKYNEECIDVIDTVGEGWNKRFLLDRYYDSFVWRNGHTSLDTFIDIINKYGIQRTKIWNIFIENATKLHSELNADGLSKMLRRYKMNRRDSLWTTAINDLTENDRIVNLAYYIERGEELASLGTEKARLLLVLFSWMLSSSNRMLRDHVSKAMIEILKTKFELSLVILKEFRDIDDPYIKQRLYGVVFGAVMKRTNIDQNVYRDLAKWVAENVFLQGMVYPDILLRDYARLIVERYIFEFHDNEIIKDIDRIRPPYRSEPIPNVEPVDYDDPKYDDTAISMLLFSMKFNLKVNGRGFYGDFGRYVFQSALSDFMDVDLENAYYYSLDFIFNDLGYTSELFGEYDAHVSGRSRNDTKKVERIGKKYQWIAMYNVLARISDTHNVSGWDWNDTVGEPYQGAWEPYVRDFNPTLNAYYGKDPQAPLIKLPEYRQDEFICSDSKEKEIQRWTQEESLMFSAYPERFLLHDDSGAEWISLYHYCEHKMVPEGGENHTLGFCKGEQHIWTLSTAYLMPRKNAEDLLQISEIIGHKEDNHRVRDCYSLFNREYAWSPGYAHEFRDYGRCEKQSGDQIDKVIPAAINVLWEGQFDASQEDTVSFMIPNGEILSVLGLSELRYDGFYYADNELVAFDLIFTSLQLFA